ncbi:uncharacterized protein LOC6567860 [Drosophila grimshawi]|uniref:GH22887 n=1 Tax=Drosophila grimshawi TaxID=7222 RepID=B4JSS2_DROGR|nr:uncharacterized protein LOC6567860 [Drosophila grimshawi]EDV94812.1 GH22887 [Drosophila grimshawi]
MEKPQCKQCWTLLLFTSLIASFVIMTSFWFLMPHQMHIWQLFDSNDSGSAAAKTSTAELKFFMPPQTVPKELKLKRGAPFIYELFP